MQRKDFLRKYSLQKLAIAVIALHFSVNFSSIVYAQETGVGAGDISPNNESLPQVQNRYTSTLTWARHRNATVYTQAADRAFTQHSQILNSPTGRALDQIKTICPRFESMGFEQKKYFWIHVASEVASRESLLDPNKVYEERRFRHYGLYGQLLRTEEHPNACHLTREAAVNLDSANECFFRLLSNKLTTANCLYCSIDSLDLLWLSRKEARSALAARLKNFIPCHENDLVSYNFFMSVL